MKFSKKNKILIILSLIILNIVIRIPVIPHEMGMDSFYLHSLATTISSFGYAKWIIHPASIFGLYPFSYPSSLPIALSGISQSSGIDIEYCLLFLDIILSIFALLSTYILAKIIFYDDLFAFIAAFCYSLSPLVLIFTYWEGSSRNIYLAFTPLFLWVLLKITKSVKLRYILLYFLLILVLYSSHRLALFSIVTTLVLIGSVIIFIIYNKFKKFKFNNSRIHMFYILVNILIVLLFINFGDFESYLALGRHYFGGVGPMIIFGFVGLFYIIWKYNINIGSIFILSTVLVSPFIMQIDTYGRFMEIIFIIILIAFGISYLNSKRNIFRTLLAVSLIVSIIFSLYMLNRDFDHTIAQSTVNTATFLRDKTTGASVANSGAYSTKLSAFSGKPVLPFGGPYAPSKVPEILIYDIYPINNSYISMGSFLDIPKSDVLYYDYSNLSSGDDWQTIMGNNYWDEAAKDMLLKYKANMVIEIGESGTYRYWKDRYSIMLVSLHNSGNKIYTSGQENENIYFVRS